MKKLSKGKRRIATSPIIATILLLGLTVLSGAILYGVTTAYLSQQPTLGLNYESPAVYQSTETNYLFSDSKVNSFDISVSNPNYNQMMINLAGSKVFYANGTQLTTWRANYNSTSTILLNGRQSTVVNFQTPTNAIGSQPMDIGQKFYVEFSINSPDYASTKTITTTNFTVSQSNFLPNFVFIPTAQTTVQDGYNVTFFGNSNQPITNEINGILWNYGNPNSSYQKTIQFFVSNDTVFTVDPAYAKPQTITIPASNVIGDQGDPNTCSVGLACTNITIPVTKNAMNTTETAFGGILSITGMNLINFQLNINNPPIRITLENTNRFNWGNLWNWRKNLNQCPSFPNWNNYNQITDTVVYYGSPSCMDTKQVTFDIWNLETSARNANIEIIGLNSTAFTLYTEQNSTQWLNPYNSEPASVYLTAGPGRTYKWITSCRNPPAQACNTVTWGIARNPLVDGNGNPTGIMAGNYPIIIKDTVSGVEQQFNLYIQPYITTVHVASLSGNYYKNQKTLTFSVSVEDQNNHPVRFVQVTASYTVPNGNNGKTKTTTEILYTSWNGVATFIDFNPVKGEHTFQVTDISSFTFGISGSWSRLFSPTVIIYDSSANTPNPPIISVTV